MITFEGYRKVRVFSQPLKTRSNPESMVELLQAQIAEYKFREGRKNFNIFTKTKFFKTVAKTDIYAATGDEGRFLNNLKGAQLFLLTFKINNNIHPEKTKGLDKILFEATQKAHDFVLKYGKKNDLTDAKTLKKPFKTNVLPMHSPQEKFLNNLFDAKEFVASLKKQKKIDDEQTKPLETSISQAILKAQKFISKYGN